jgi:hypothetical protein
MFPLLILAKNLATYRRPNPVPKILVICSSGFHYLLMGIRAPSGGIACKKNDVE